MPPARDVISDAPSYANQIDHSTPTMRYLNESGAAINDTS
jgi:hypothetical protein